MTTLVAALNNSGVAILQGQVVYQTGFSNPQQVPTIALASASSITTSIVFGLANETILDGEIGTIAISEDFSPIDTSGFMVNDVVYLSNTLGGISAIPGTVTSIIGRVQTVSLTGCIYIRCKSPTCPSDGGGGSGDQGVTGIQGATGIGSGGGGGTGASNTLNMSGLGLLAFAGGLPAVNIGPELVGGATTFVDFRGRRGTPGSSGITTIQLELNGSPVGGATLSWTPVDAAWALKSVVIAVPVVAGDRLSFRLNSREGGPVRDLITEVNA